MANLQKGVLDKVDHFFTKQNLDYEVLIVDDGSTDGSVGFDENFVKENQNSNSLKIRILEKPEQSLREC